MTRGTRPRARTRVARTPLPAIAGTRPRHVLLSLAVRLVTRMTVTARQLLTVALTFLAVLTWIPASLGARTHPGADRGCGVLVDSAHTWHSRVPDGNVETGDHWITARNGRFSTCAFTQVAIHRLLALPARTYQADNVGQLLGGVCDWTHGTGHETIRPFAEIECHLPTPRHSHIAAATVIALVDPDPAFIH